MYSSIESVTTSFQEPLVYNFSASLEAEIRVPKVLLNIFSNPLIDIAPCMEESHSQIRLNSHIDIPDSVNLKSFKMICVLHLSHFLSLSGIQVASIAGFGLVIVLPFNNRTFIFYPGGIQMRHIYFVASLYQPYVSSLLVRKCLRFSISFTKLLQYNAQNFKTIITK